MSQNHSYGRSGTLQPTALRCVLQEGPVVSQPHVPGVLLRSVTTLTKEDLPKTLKRRPESVVEVKRNSDPQEGNKPFSLKDALFPSSTVEFFTRLGSGRSQQHAIGHAAASVARTRKFGVSGRKSHSSDLDSTAKFYTQTDGVSGMGAACSRRHSGPGDTTKSKSDHRKDRKISLDTAHSKQNTSLLKHSSTAKTTTKQHSKPHNASGTQKPSGNAKETKKTANTNNTSQNTPQNANVKGTAKDVSSKGDLKNTKGHSKDLRDAVAPRNAGKPQEVPREPQGKSVKKKSTRRKFFTGRPQCAGPEEGTTTEEEEVDGGGGEGKKWIRNSSLRRHFPPDHSADPSHSDTELGKISASHSLLDGECVSVGGSSMTSERAIDVGRVGSWATSFEKLLEDPAGLHTFAEFLKKEYSHENIYFWTACERYKRLTSPDELRATARQIFERHLYSGAPEPVNVDSQARQDAQDGLHLPNESLFAQAQKQIFNLMKFDSYSRFLKSSLYQDCLAQEMRGQQLPYPGDDTLDPDLRIGGEDSHVKLKKSRSDADERRRKSLLPWNRKDRSKSKDRGEAEYRRRKKSSHRNTSDSSSLRSDVSGSRTSLNSSDLPLGRRVASRESLTSGDQGSLSGSEGNARCRVILPDLTNSVVAIKGSETIQEVMGRLLERRGLIYSTFEVYNHKTDKLINQKEDSTILGGLEVRLEQRAFFQLDLPSHKMVYIKAKPTKTTGEVLKPILQKYGFKIDLLHIHRDGEEKAISLKSAVTDIDGVRLVVQTKEEVKEWGVESGRSRRRGGSSATLDEITNRVFQDLRNGKTDHHFDDMGVMDLDARSCRTDSSDKSSGILGSFSRRNSFGPDKDINSKGRKTRGSVHDSFALLTHSEHHSLVSKRRGGSGTPLQNKQENDELYEGLKRAQMSRLDDQRGTEINFELPDFLKNDQPQDKASPRVLAEQLLARLECSFPEGVVGGPGGEYFSLAHPEVWGGLPSPPLPPPATSANTTLVADLGGDLGGDLDLDDFEDTLRGDADPSDLPPSPPMPQPTEGGAVPPRIPLTALPLSPPPLPPKPKVGGVRGPPPRPPSRHLLNPPPPSFPPPPPSSSNSEDEGGLCAPPDQLPPLPPLHLGRHDKFNISFV